MTQVHEQDGEVGVIERRLPSPDRWPDLWAAAAFLFATLVLVITVVPPWYRYFAANDDIVSLLLVPVFPGLVYAALLYVMGVALRRRLRPALVLALVWWFLVPSVGRVWNAVDGNHRILNIVGLLISLVLVLLAWRVRSQFVARRVPGSLRRAAAVFLGGGVVMLLLGSVLVRSFGTAEDFGEAALYVLGTMFADVGRAGGDLVSGVSAPIWVRIIMGVLGAGVVIGAAVIFFRAPRPSDKPDALDEAVVRAMVRDHGEDDSLGYFATRRDKAVVWDSGDAGTARAGVSFRAIGSVCLASGNPVGEREYWPEAIAAWRRWSREQGLSLAVMGAGRTGAQAYADAGLTMLDIGDEAVVDMTNFSLNAPGMKEVRRSVTRLQRRGYTAVVLRHSALDAEDFAALADAAEHWRGDGGDERGFSMALGRLADPLDGDCVLVRAIDETGQLRGFLSFVPWGRTGLSLDLMRRDPTADNGLVEFLVGALAAEASRIGVGPVSLNFAMFREAFERGAQVGAGPVARVWRQGLLLASKTWQLESLYRSNAKYLPDWQPRYMGYEYASDLPRVGTAAGSAEGFLTAPSIALLRRRGRSDGGLATGAQDYAEQVRALIPPARDVVAEALSIDRLPEQMRVRRLKLDRLRADGVDPYPATAPRTHTLAQVRIDAGVVPADAETGTVVSVVGRVVLKRDMGHLAFATLRDGSGDLQVMVDVQHLGERDLHFWEHSVDLGDQVGVTGDVVTTHTGELSVRATSVMMTSKSLRPLPDKHKGLTDPEARIRTRYVDLIVRPEARTVAYQRATVVRSIRDSLQARGFTEVETPILQTVHGGANARPFQTHINAYDMDLYLRIATELHLKRLLVGGMEKVFEVGRQFRNEGADFKHNPEFTSLEVYETYGDYNTMRVLTQQLIQEAAVAVHGEPVARRHDRDGKVVEYDLSGDWPVKTMCQAVSEALGEEITADTPITQLLRHAEHAGAELGRDPTWGAALEGIYEELCEGQTTTPVFYTDFPKENAPLTRPHRSDGRLAEKWDLVIFGAEQAPPTPNWSIRSTSASDSSLSRCWPRPAMWRRCRSTRTSSRRWSTACHRQAGWGWASTVWS